LNHTEGLSLTHVGLYFDKEAKNFNKGKQVITKEEEGGGEMVRGRIEKKIRKKGHFERFLNILFY
jgi:hypothetical protein